MLVQGLFLKCFKGSLLTYLNFPRQPLISKNYCFHLHFSTALTYTIPIIKNEFVKTADLTPESVLKLISLPQNDEKLVKIVNEVNYVVGKQYRCPEFLNSSHIYELYVLETKSQRMKYLKFLFKKEKAKESDVSKKQEVKPQNIKQNNEIISNCSFSKYGPGYKTLLLCLRRPSLLKFQNRRLANAALFGSKIVIDLDYDKIMVEKERKSCASQLRLVISSNRRNRNPFDLYFCNANPSYRCVQYLKRDVPNIEDSLNSLCEESYLNYFPKENLVYLSPHASESLESFDPSAIYIIGGFVDVAKKQKVSTEKALTEGIKSYSLPLDKYVKWKSGSKSLTINQVFDIMLTLKNTGSWKKAFECIPVRKTRDLEHLEENEPSSFVDKLTV